MAEVSRTRGTIKFIFWTVISLVIILYVVRSYASGQMARWYYYRAAFDGYAIQTKTFKDATKEKPAVLQIKKEATEIVGPMAIPVKKGDRLPEHTNGIIGLDVLKKGKRAVMEGDTIKVFIPWEIKESKGFKYKDTFVHKGIQTNPWSGAWNVAVVIALGLSLGLMAEGFTDILGFKIKKIEHYGH